MLQPFALSAHRLLVYRQAAFGMHVVVALRALLTVFGCFIMQLLVAHDAHLFTLQL